MAKVTAIVKACDALLSEIIRMRDMECVVCHKERRWEYLYPHHTFSRRCHELRFDLRNSDIVCDTCHRHIESNRQWWAGIKIARIGSEAFYEMKRISTSIPKDKLDYAVIKDSLIRERQLLVAEITGRIT